MITPVSNPTQPVTAAKPVEKTETPAAKPARRFNPDTALQGYSPSSDPYGMRGRLVDVWA